MHREILPNITRNDYYKIVGELIEENLNNNTILEDLLDLELSLVGHCSEYSIDRFYDEPNNHQERVSNVRCLAWRT